MTMTTTQMSSRKTSEDREALVKPEPKYYSQLCIWSSIFVGVAIVSAAIYGFMKVLHVDQPAENYDDVEANGRWINSSAESLEGHKPQHGDQCKPVDIGFLILAIRWSIGACESLHCMPHLQKEWLIHGLWPNYNNDSWPEFCCDKDGFDVSKVQPLLPKLEKSWKNLLLNEESSSLWKHEWDKHGTCSYQNEKIRGEMNYFSKSLVLFEAVNVGRLLEDFNIKPGTKTTKEAVKKALSKPFGTQVSVHCVPEGLYLESEPVKSIQKNHDLRNQVLESVHFCYSHDTIEPMDCPDSDQCPSSFMYPSQLSK